jgi:ATP-dependent Clp protease ATP-binding subunit ClpA
VFERFTTSARAVVVAAQDEARRREHPQITTPHLLLALVDGDTGEFLRAHGVTRETVERELASLLARDPRAADDDAEVLAALGIDVARIREAVEASFGPGALERALDVEPPHQRGLLARLTAGRLGRHPRDEVTVLRLPARRSSTHIPFSPAAKKALELSLRETVRLGGRSIDAGHVTLGLLRTSDGAAAAILTTLGVDVAALRRTLEQARRRSA